MKTERERGVSYRSYDLDMSHWSRERVIVEEEELINSLLGCVRFEVPERYLKRDELQDEPLFFKHSVFSTNNASMHYVPPFYRQGIVCKCPTEAQDQYLMCMIPNPRTQNGFGHFPTDC